MSMPKRKTAARLLTLALALGLAAPRCAAAQAYVDPDWELGKGPAEPGSLSAGAADLTGTARSVTVVPEQPFSTPGNGNLADAIPSGSKDFYTIRTKNSNTFYLVIDHAGSVDNVYLLSLVDENDLADFLEETEKAQETPRPTVWLPQTTPRPTPVPAESETAVPQPESRNPSGALALLPFALIGGGAALWYFKVYRPRKEGEQSMSEGLETEGDGLETEREDEADDE